MPNFVRIEGTKLSTSMALLWIKGMLKLDEESVKPDEYENRLESG